MLLRVGCKGKMVIGDWSKEGTEARRSETESMKSGGNRHTHLHPLYTVLSRKLSGLHCLARLYKLTIPGATQGATKCYRVLHEESKVLIFEKTLRFTCERLAANGLCQE